MDNDVPCSSDLMEPVVQLEAQLADAVKSLTLKEEQFIGLEKDFSITKADLHLAHCENIEVTEKNSQLIQENAVYSKEIEVYKRYAQIYQDSKSEIVELKETLAKKEEQLVSLTKNVNEEMEKVRLSEIQHNQLTEGEQNIKEDLHFILNCRHNLIFVTFQCAMAKLSAWKLK